MIAHWGTFIELMVVLSFALGWGLLELITLRMDRRRAADALRHAAASEASEKAASTVPRGDESARD